ncbi:oxygen-insensitive NADPH nitroreductase [Wielerella bovis]|uniref:oxygen-insensitive NADPH nitroreductase n=1 Tax=Wielerella bovis TaxID=2917790 RepID=UPI0020187290|nr:oxygen-insensitive NADPH nitroreductase [Wielerella bovis]ULJ68390.1 oxygen-insensitive NADPH nitroreductase [Wielerella bovis]
MQNSTPTLNTIFQHRSIRQFTDEAIAPETLQMLIAAGQAASTSSFLQNVSVIRVSDLAKRAQIRPICAGEKEGHAYVERCAEFLVFCADMTRHAQLVPEVQLDWTEVLLVGAVDVGIFAQNVLLAAESIGLGGVFIGSIRNNLPEIAQILQLPQGVVPIVAMCLGYPKQDPAPRPRLPQNILLSGNVFQAASTDDLQAYNEVVRQYYRERSQLDLDWVQQIRTNFARPVRPDLLPFLQKQGFAKR